MTSAKTTTYEKTNPKSIQTMFGTIAEQYDRTNALMSFQLHRYWNAQLINSIGCPATLLDLCCGTGEIAFGFLKKTPYPTEAYLLDFCPEMLACARQKGTQISGHTLHYLEADAQAIPLPDHSVNAITIAYGIRNVNDPALCFRECFRVLKPGGCLGILELTRPRNRLLRLGHSFYLRAILPLVGKFSASNQDAYQYLSSSIETFAEPTVLEMQLREAGFPRVRIRPLIGGIATVITAYN